MKVSKILLLAILIFLQSCAFNQNDDNEIYLPGREFQFVVYYSDSTDSLRKVDTLELKVTNDFYPQRSQTAIDWIHHQANKNDTTIVKETTGVIDSKDSYFIHPPREGDLHILSFAEFPTINTFVFKDSTSKSNSTGKVSMAKTYKGKTITHVETNQKYQGKTTIDIPYQKNYRVHHLKATAKSELGTILGNYYFSEKLGFVRLDYELPDQTKISMQLSRIDFKKF